ncbi:hypothetical protein [Actinoplanes sp. NPDC051494]|uniref:hypothetical protein n=1 Tax=Actinoplanes sp. NPDC051494 TaxID=3363907 RepID=UPI0037A19E5E
MAGDAFWDTYAIAVAMPGVTTVQISTTTVDQELRPGPLTATGRFIVRALPSATDAQGVRGDVVKRSDQQIVVVFPANRAVRPGQLAVVAEGLVGRVTTIDPSRSRATIDVVTSSPGSVRGTGGKLLMERIPAGEKMEINQGNRVLVADPSQQGDHLGAITIGRAAVTGSAGTDTVELTSTANLADGDQVSIMTPFDGDTT